MHYPPNPAPRFARSPTPNERHSLPSRTQSKFHLEKVLVEGVDACPSASIFPVPVTGIAVDGIAYQSQIAPSVCWSCIRISRNCTYIAKHSSAFQAYRIIAPRLEPPPLRTWVHPSGETAFQTPAKASLRTRCMSRAVHPISGRIAG